MGKLSENKSFPVNIIAHEFFDALPSLRFRFEKGLWHEILVGLEGIQFHQPDLAKSIPNLYQKDFKEILSNPFSQTVKKVLNPKYRF